MKMIPMGYMLKKVVASPEWLGVASVESIHAVSGCVSENFLDYITLWKHNDWWLFDNPSILRSIAADHQLDLDALTLFYYEAFENEYVATAGVWRPIEPDGPTNVDLPPTKSLSGYDVVTFWLQTSPECSPLSCNSLAREMIVNRFCLFDDFATAFDSLEQGKFNNSEPSPYRIFAVYTVDGV